jgi:hypothetical protein
MSETTEFIPRLLTMKKWEKVDNYAGKDWSDWYLPFNFRAYRGCDLATRSNFLVAIRDIEKILGREIPSGEAITDDDKVIIGEFRHWGVGQLFCLMIHQDAPVAILKEVEQMLAHEDEYRIIDEEHHSDMIRGWMKGRWDAMPTAERMALIIELEMDFGLVTEEFEKVCEADEDRKFWAHLCPE